jgi:5-methylcytosine-specific restriction endonuclease McrA
MERKSIHEINDVFNVVKPVLDISGSKEYVELDGDMIKGNSQRYQVFFHKGITCVKCGLRGRYFAKEKYTNSKRYHLNLYAIDETGKEVLMTKDHIVPKSKGGKDTLENYQCMCSRCNQEKKDNLE